MSDESDGIIPRAIKNLWYFFKDVGSIPKRKMTNIRLKLPSQRYTTSRSEICWILGLECCIADGILPMDSSLRIWLLWTARALMIWLRFWMKVSEIERVDRMSSTKIRLVHIRWWRSMRWAKRKEKITEEWNGMGKYLLLIWQVVKDWRSPNLQDKWQNRLRTSINHCLR